MKRAHSALTDEAAAPLTKNRRDNDDDEFHEHFTEEHGDGYFAKRAQWREDARGSMIFGSIMRPVAEDAAADAHNEEHFQHKESGTWAVIRGRRPTQLRHVSFRRRLGRFLESHRFQLVVLTFIILDVMMVFGEVMLSGVCSHTHVSVHGGRSR